MIKRLGILISGSGTNLQAIIEACHNGELHGVAEVALVISDKADAYGLARAEKAGIDNLAIEPSHFSDKQKFNEEIKNQLISHKIDIVVMAGYMKFLGPEVLKAFPDKVLNIHPALLPLFPGAHGIAETYNSGMGVGGVTVHFANEIFDEGPILLQRAIPIERGDSIEDFEAKVHQIEYQIYPLAIGLLASELVEVADGKVKFKNPK